MRLQQRLLKRLHQLGFFVEFVIMAEQVQHAVHDKKREFVIEGPAMMVLAFVVRRVRGSDRGAHDDVADQVVGLTRIRAIEREGQHVGGRVLVAVFEVELLDRRLIDEQQVALAGGDALIDEGGDSKRLPTVEIDLDIVLFVDGDDGRTRLTHEEPRPSGDAFS